MSVSSEATLLSTRRGSDIQLGASPGVGTQQVGLDLDGYHTLARSFRGSNPGHSITVPGLPALCLVRPFSYMFVVLVSILGSSVKKDRVFPGTIIMTCVS